MNICFLADAMSVHTKEWAEYFVRSGHSVSVISFYPPLKIEGARVIYLSNRLPQRLKYIVSIPIVRRHIHSIAPDLLVAYFATSNGFMAACSGFHPWVLATAGSDIMLIPKESWSMKRVVSFALKRADLITTWSSHVRAEVMRYGLNEKSVVTFPRGVDARLFKRRDRTEDRIRIISTRAFKSFYNVALLVQSAPHVLKEYENCEFIFLNDGPCLPEAKKQAMNLGLDDKVKFVGAVDHLTVAEYLADSTIYVSTSLTDGVSASLLEAMACGLFPVVTDIDANREWIEDGKNGFLVPTDDPSFLAGCLIEAIKNKELRSSARQINFDIIASRGLWQKNMKCMEDLYVQTVTAYKNKV